MYLWWEMYSTSTYSFSILFSVKKTNFNTQILSQFEDISSIYDLNFF